ncbi:MAG: type III secretion system chaperone [Kiritimatiellae bacterium]|nr:type III secretion system chaperone [Kiritimatiellia bacterium]
MTFGELVDRLGVKLGVEIEDAGGAVAIQVDGETVVLQHADDDLVLLRADLGEIPPDRRDALASAALRGNFLYRGTGGATLAVNPADSHLHLHKYNWLGRLDADKALDMLSRFADSIGSWKRIVRDSGSLPSHGLLEDSLIQV